MATGQVLTVEGLRVCFGSICVLENIDFDLAKGEFLMVLGPNGAGKSVLMKAILGLLDFEGKVQIFGKEIDSVREYIGYVPQYVDFDRSFPITLEEVVGLGLVGQKVSNARARVDEIIDLVGLSDKKRAFFGSLSGGQMRRALLARALVKKPKLLFLDEPLAGVDVLGEMSFYEMMDEWHKKLHLTTVMISHDYDLVGKIATKILCINRSKLCFGGLEQLTTENFHKTFGKDLTLHKH